VSPIWLVGMMGSGKTTSGRIAAATLGIGFTDIDGIVEEEDGRTISEIWEAEGEAGFRKREAAAVAIAARHDGIVATGGGSVIDLSNRQLMSSTGPVVWLDISTRAALARLGEETTTRPLLGGSDPNEALERLDAERRPIYRLMATHHIECDGREPEAVAAEIEAIWRG
jgi:shikimate kinase